MRGAFISDNHATATSGLTFTFSAHEHFYARIEAVHFVSLFSDDV
jgi:hypothetical protein